MTDMDPLHQEWNHARRLRRISRCKKSLGIAGTVTAAVGAVGLLAANAFVQIAGFLESFSVVVGGGIGVITGGTMLGGAYMCRALEQKWRSKGEPYSWRRKLRQGWQVGSERTIRKERSKVLEELRERSQESGYEYIVAYRAESGETIWATDHNPDKVKVRKDFVQELAKQGGWELWHNHPGPMGRV